MRLQSPAVKKLWKTPPNGRREAPFGAIDVASTARRRSCFSCGPVPGAVCVALPWIILYFGGLDLYLYVLVGFALIMMFLNRRERLVKSRTGEQPAVEGIEENRSVRKCPCCRIVIEILLIRQRAADAAGGPGGRST